MIIRRQTLPVRVGNKIIGGTNPILVQSMTKTDTRDIKSTIAEIHALEQAGCELVRVAVPDMESVKQLGKIKKAISIPLVADIHFDYRLALEAIRQEVDKVRINPGNISFEDFKKVIINIKKAKKALRIGVNAGSLKTIKRGMTATQKAIMMVSAALEYINLCEQMHFSDIIISLKAADILTTIESYRIISQKVNYPLHLGITEAGPLLSGAIKSSIGIATLLNEGIGDTIRVSLTGASIEEVKVGYQILQTLGLRSSWIDIISCPSCARCKIDLLGIVNQVEKTLTSHFLLSTSHSHPIKVAIMGCVVNGPGEARDADIGIAGGKNTGVLFKQGKIIKKVPPEKWVQEIIKEINHLK